MHPEPPVVTASNMTKVFKQVKAVDGLNLSVNAGEIFGLVGPDGAGKTTTIRLLSAIMNPTEGEATVAGFDTVRDPEPIKRRIGYMSQRFNLYRDLTVGENLDFFADIFDVDAQVRIERIERLLHFARLSDFRGRRAAHLSGGMQKKLALACTLIHTPDILFLDEPTTGVDPVSRREFWDILTDLHIQGITLIVSTPYMDEAERCSRVGLMYLGKFVVCDSPHLIKQMTPGELIALWPSNVRRAKEVLQRLEGVLEVQTYGEQLRVFVDDAQSMMVVIKTALSRNGLESADMRLTQPRMEEAFISLVSRQSERKDDLAVPAD